MKRVIIKNISHDIENGKYPAKGIIGDEIFIYADIFSDGHDDLSGSLLVKKIKDRTWKEFPMEFISNDRWKSYFIPLKVGKYVFSIEGWINHFATWQKGLIKKFNAGKDISIDIKIGFEIFNDYEAISKGAKAKEINNLKEDFIKHTQKPSKELFLSLENAASIMNSVRDVKSSTIHSPLELEIGRLKSRFSTWYEIFPRSTSLVEKKHGTFADVLPLLPLIAEQGFDTLYFPPIHPIGVKHRKGKNNSLTTEKNDPGSPWAIGSKEGGHKSIHPELGNLNDFKNVLLTAKKFDIEIALDIAFQCSPDHPYITEHPQWFKWRPDGTIQYAENPPKKYEDIVPFDFETKDWEALWEELKSIVDYWIKVGVTIFRVDNPHTKSLPFWQWMISEIRKKNPDIIFLAEAFTRPRIMEELALSGFDQSYTYFTWRNTKEELEEYLRELSTSKMKYFFRPNFWPNTPDILPPFLTDGGENAHLIRLILAATLSSNYGIYGPVYEFGMTQPMAGKEEYIDNEKYEIKNWDWNKYTKIKEVIGRINTIRKENTALQYTDNIHFATTTNSSIICYGKKSPAEKNIIITAVNLDPFQIQEAIVNIPLENLGIKAEKEFIVRDLLSGDKYRWKGKSNYVKLNPFDLPAHVFRVEQDF
jgi:starch synthase (maltosyl-transferring)